MATDVKLDQVDGNYLVLEANAVKTTASDLLIDSAARHKGGGSLRRALVHDQSDGLTVNFNGDYPAGITLVNVAEIVPKPAGTIVLAPPTLVVRGGISYEVQTISPVRGGGGRATVNLAEEIANLQNQINQLTTRVEALEKK